MLVLFNDLCLILRDFYVLRHDIFLFLIRAGISVQIILQLFLQNNVFFLQQMKHLSCFLVLLSILLHFLIDLLQLFFVDSLDIL